MIGGSSYRLNWDKHFSSDWLSSFADITLDAPSDSRLSALLSATYEITSGPIGSGSVYFDDISVVTLEAVPSNGRCGSLYSGYVSPFSVHLWLYIIVAILDVRICVCT